MNQGNNDSNTFRDFEKIPEQWDKISSHDVQKGDYTYVWLREWGSKLPQEQVMDTIKYKNQPSRLGKFRIKDHIVAMAKGGGIIATYKKHSTDIINSANPSKFVNIFYPNLKSIHRINIALEKPNVNKEWFEFAKVVFIGITQDELIVILLANFTILIFTAVGVLVRFTVLKGRISEISSTFPKIVHFSGYSMCIISINQVFLYIPDVRVDKVYYYNPDNDRRINSNDTDDQTNVCGNYKLSPYVFDSVDFNFIPLEDSIYPFLYCVTGNGSLLAIHGQNMKKIADKNYNIIGICLSADNSSIAFMMIKKSTEELNVVFTSKLLTSLKVIRLQTKQQRHQSQQQSEDGTNNNENAFNNDMFDEYQKKIFSTKFNDICWCGNESVIISYNEHCLFVHNSGAVKMIENPSENVIISPEIDGARIVSEQTQDDGFYGHHIFVSIVPKEVTNIFSKRGKSRILCTAFNEWRNGNFQEEKYQFKQDEFQNKMKEEYILEITKSAQYITETNIQKFLLGAVWFAQTFLDSFHRIPLISDTENENNTAIKARALNFLRENRNNSKIKINNSNNNISNNNNTVMMDIFNKCEEEEEERKVMLLTYQEMENIGFESLVLRLCNRGAYVSAFALAEMVDSEKGIIHNHCAQTSIYKVLRGSSSEKSSKNPDAIIDSCILGLKNLDFAHLAMSAFSFGENSMKRVLCRSILKREPIQRKKISTLLLLGDLKEAISIAVENGDQSILNCVIKAALDSHAPELVASLYNNTVISSSSSLSPIDLSEDQLPLLVFRIRNMQKDAALSYLFATMKADALPHPEILKELKIKLNQLRLTHYRSFLIKYKRLHKLLAEQKMKALQNNNVKKEDSAVESEKDEAQKDLKKEESDKESNDELAESDASSLPKDKKERKKKRMSRKDDKKGAIKDTSKDQKVDQENTTDEEKTDAKKDQNAKKVTFGNENENLKEKESENDNKETNNNEIIEEEEEKPTITILSSIETALKEERFDDADEIVKRVEMSEQRYYWIKINYYLKNNGSDESLIKLKNGIKLIDGLWVVRRCIILRRFNVAAAFSAEITKPEDKFAAQKELQAVLAKTSRKT